ncbi:hypothetical protein DFH27DRAFT_560087 [Peziza echinospora]|nr:hypothetical protein DFH27DRAFT_560087 [Peziza echinospora]
MNSARSSLSIEGRIPPDISENAEFSYPEDWPLSNASAAPPASAKDAVEQVPAREQEEQRHAAGITTPPNQFKQQHGRISSLDSAASVLVAASRLRSASSPRRKRLSLSFPVQPTRNVASSFTSPRTPTSPVESAQLLPTDTATFLTTLAAQERRVFELKEDLAKAETELTKLKQQWALLEGTKRRHELLQVEVQRGGAISDSPSITSPTFEERDARRKAAMAKLTQASTQSVTSQRHYRTLSLLSPQRTTYAQPFPQPSDLNLKDDDAESSTSSSNRSVTATPPVRRTGTLPNGRPQSMIETSSLSLKRNNQDVLMRTGRQMADGFRDGLWAFVEDLRQATVGDDIRPTGSNSSRSGSSLGTVHNLRRQGSKNSLRSVSSAGGSGGGNTRRAKSPAEPESGPWALSKHEDTSLPAASGSARWSTSSTTLSDLHHHNLTSSPNTSASTRSSTPRTSTSSVQSSTSSSSGGGGYQGLQLPLWGSVMSASTQFNLKKVAAGVINSVEKTLAVVAGDEELMAYGASNPPSPQLERRDSGMGVCGRREKAESVTGRSAGKEQGAGTTTTLLRQRSVRSEAGGGGGARGATKAKRS